MGEMAPRAEGTTPLEPLVEAQAEPADQPTASNPVLLARAGGCSACGLQFGESETAYVEGTEARHEACLPF